MYVIFPAEEVVFLTYGYRVVTPPPNSDRQTPQSDTGEQSTVVDSNTNPDQPELVTTVSQSQSSSTSITQQRVSSSSTLPVTSATARKKNPVETSATNSSSSQKSQTLSKRGSSASKGSKGSSKVSDDSRTKFDNSSPLNVGKYPNTKDILTPVRPSRKSLQRFPLSTSFSETKIQKSPTRKEQQIPDDFFEIAKTRPRLETFKFNLQVPDSSDTLKKAKSAPNTPIASRKSQPKFRSFETERQDIAALHLLAEERQQQSKNLLQFIKDKSLITTASGTTQTAKKPQNLNLTLQLSSDLDRLQRRSQSPRIITAHSTPEKSPTKRKSFFSSLPRIRKRSSAGSSSGACTGGNHQQIELLNHNVATSATVNYTINHNMATASHTTVANNEPTLRELTHSSYNEHLKTHNAVTFKLVKTVSDFTQHLSQIYEQHAEQLQLLVENFRKRNAELRKERPACPSSLFHTWETLLQEVEIDSQNHSDIASILGRQVSRPLLERSFHRKIQSRKVFTHRDSYETIISKTEEKLGKCRQDYKNAYLSYLSGPTPQSLSAYFNTHNAYVQQLHATNGMLDEYTKRTLPNLLKELEEIYIDLCSSVTEAILQGAEVISQRAADQTKRYDSLSGQCRSINGATDLAHLVRSLPQPAHNKPILRRLFNPPQPPHPDASPESGATTAGSDADRQFDHINEQNIPPPLKDELVVDRLASVQIKPSLEALKKESNDLDIQIKQIQDSLDTLQRMQQRSLESNLFNKVNELQEDISIKRFDLHVAQIHLSAINSQKELFTNKLDTGDTGRERKMSSASQGSMKSKWLKAFKSLKTPPSSSNTSPKESEKDKKNGGAVRNMGESDVHNFQEYTYKKITPCDVCSQVLRGHTRQGLKCRVCKMNVHVDCQDKATKCQSKSRLLRRQKSTSEIDTRINETTVEEESNEDFYYTYPKLKRHLSFKTTHSRVTYVPPPDDQLESPEVDLIYQVLKQATDLSNNSKTNRSSPYEQDRSDRSDRLPVGIVVPERTNATSGGGSVSASAGGPGSGAGSSGSSSGQSLHRFRSIAGAAAQQRSSGGGGTSSTTPSTASNLTVSNPAPHSTSSDRRPISGPTRIPSDGSMRRRLFAGMKSLTGFGSRSSRHGSPNNRSISLPETPHSPRRQKLNLRMKSLSLDSPESTEHVQRRRGHGGVGVAATSATTIDHSNSSSSRLQSPSSPVHNRRLLSARNMRMSSVELPDDNEKSLSSASTSPCPSPVGGKKSHRLLPTNLYVILYNYKSRQPDELDLKAGYKVTVIDTSDNDWWKGKCLGKVGYFPSKYCTKLAAGEKPLQVTQNLRIAGGDNNEGLLLLRDQIVIQIADEIDGMIMVRNGNNQTGCCPAMFLQEV